MKYTIDSARQYILDNKHKVNSYYKGIYHFQPEIGWINDPNGLVYFNNEYHIFYQYYPYDIKPGPMHWGHAVSKDLLTFTHLDIFLSPLNQDVESGCFSGSAIVDNNELFISYTRHYENCHYKKEEQYLLSLDNPYNLIKIVEDDELPNDCDTSDFRDPHIFKKDNYYYLLVGSRNIKENKGVLLVFRSETLSNFKYHFQIADLKEFGVMCECPDYFYSNGYDVIVTSGVSVKGEEEQYLNPNGSSVLIGHIDFENKKYEILSAQEIDKGDGFYAPKLIQNAKENIMIAWMEMWGKDIPTQFDDHNWAGALTFPRNIFIKEGKFYQYPIDNITKLYKRTYCLDDNNIIKRNADISIVYNDDFSVVFKGVDSNYNVKIYKENGYIYLDTTNSNNLNGFIRRLENRYIGKCEIRILLDSSSLELFVNQGEEAISTRIYLESDKYETITENYDSFIINEI